MEHHLPRRTIPLHPLSDSGNIQICIRVTQTLTDSHCNICPSLRSSAQASLCHGTPTHRRARRPSPLLPLALAPRSSSSTPFGQSESRRGWQGSPSGGGNHPMTLLRGGQHHHHLDQVGWLALLSSQHISGQVTMAFTLMGSSG